MVDLPFNFLFFLAPSTDGLPDVMGDPVFCSRPESLVCSELVDSDLARFRDCSAMYAAFTLFFLAMVRDGSGTTKNTALDCEGGGGVRCGGKDREEGEKVGG